MLPSNTASWPLIVRLGRPIWNVWVYVLDDGLSLFLLGFVVSCMLRGRVLREAIWGGLG